jgi:hypothetical protein
MQVGRPLFTVPCDIEVSLCFARPKQSCIVHMWDLKWTMMIRSFIRFGANFRMFEQWCAERELDFAFGEGYTCSLFCLLCWSKNEGRGRLVLRTFWECCATQCDIPPFLARLLACMWGWMRGLPRALARKGNKSRFSIANEIHKLTQ